MRLRACFQEPELFEALRTGSWPVGCDASLREHVEHCDSCRETVLVTQLLREDRAGVIRNAALASPGLLWWRAQILQRQAAIRRASRPVHIAITISLIASLAVVFGVLLGLRSQIETWLSSLIEVPVSAQSNSISSLTIASQPLLLIVCTLAALATIGGVLVYVAVELE